MINFTSKFSGILPFIFVFLGSMHLPIDADLGWHLKYGEYFFQNWRILRENTFSTEMSTFHWANSSWLTDLLTFGVFSQVGFLGLSVLGALVITATFYVFSKAARLTLWDQIFIFPIILFFVHPVNQNAFRGQLISLLLSGVLFYFITLYKEGKKKILYLALPLFLLWVNIHGQFFLGLALFFLWITFYLVSIYLTHEKSRKEMIQESRFLSSIFFLSVVATFINPFGPRIYFDILAHVNNDDLKLVAEYLPFESLSNSWWNYFFMGNLLLFSGITLFASDKIKEKLPEFGITAFLFALAFSVKRYAWTMYYFTFFILSSFTQSFAPKSQKSIRLTAIPAFLLLIAFVLFLKQPFNAFTDYSWKTYCESYIACSPEAMKFLLQNREKYPGKMLTLYNWGGWMIWNYPQIKPSIDGRMHVWNDENGYSAFSEYFPLEAGRVDINSTDYEVVFFSPQKPLYSQMVDKVNKGEWKKVYEDENAGVFVKNK